MFSASKIAAPSAAYQISRSLRFNSADSAYLNRTPAGAGNLDSWTYSLWLKLSNLGVTREILVAYTDSNNYEYLALSSDNTLRWVRVVSGNVPQQLITTQVFRDPTAWCHLVFAYDSAQATASNRAKIYLNGAQITAFGTATYDAQNADSVINKASAHYISRFGTATEYYDGYLAEIFFIDGQALAPSSFGQTNATTGAWDPIKYTGAYGTNGFYLNFSDNSGTTATTLGKDSSGNGNNWTPNNFSVSAGAGNDSLVDTPTNYGTDTGAGGEVRGNYCTLNPLWKSSSATAVTLANGNLQVSAASGTSGYIVGSTLTVPATGKWYWEYTIDGTALVYPVPGIVTTLANLQAAGQPGDGGTGRTTGFGVFNTGQVQENGSIIFTGASFTTSDVVQIAIDSDTGKYWIGKNNTWYNSGAPASGTGNVGTNAAGYTYAPAVSVYSTGLCTLNFGQRAFTYTAPSGFKSLCTQNLPTPAITKPSLFFTSKLYTGTGAALTISGVNFSPDLVWIKSRSAATDHTLYDTQRGAQKRLESNNTDAEVTSDDGITAFNSNGFTLGALAQVNTNTATYIAWCWDESTATGFDIVLYTGNNTSNRSVSHSLGAAPAFASVKRRDSTSNWWTWHSGLTGATYFLTLNSTNAETNTNTPWGTGSWTSSVFMVTNNATENANANTATYVAYLWTPIAGFSAFNIYTGNASTDGPFHATNFSPAFIIRKSTAAGTNWQADWRDAAPTSYNGNRLYLNPNATNVESNGGGNMDVVAQGFKVRNTNTDENASGATILYAAFAETPLKYARAL